MNNSAALFYLTKRKCINTFKRLTRKPLRLVGTIIGFLYFGLLPFTFRNFILQIGMNNPKGFVIFGTAFNVWVLMPSLLSYIKRKGLYFDKSDINLMFATPMGSKGSLVYAIYRQIYFNLVLGVFVSVAGVIIFQIPLWKILLYTLCDFFLYNTAMSLVGVIIYGDYRIKESTRKMIRFGTFIIMAMVVAYLLANVVIMQTFDLNIVFTTIASPIFFLIPLIGQGLAMMQLIILGPNIYNILGAISLLLVLVLLMRRYKTMPDDGEFYEDALKFSEVMMRKQEEAKRKDATLDILRDKKIKPTKSGRIGGQGPTIIFSRQIIELKRSRRFLLGILDFVLIFISVVVGCVLYFNSVVVSKNDFIIYSLGLIIYINVFTSRKYQWVKEFENAIFFLMPYKVSVKLFYANLLDILLSTLRMASILIPIGMGLRINIFTIVCLILISTLIELMVSASKMVFLNYLSNKLGDIIGSIVSMIVSAIILTPPALFLILAATSMSLWVGLIIIIVYSLILSALFLYGASKIYQTMDVLN